MRVLSLLCCAAAIVGCAKAENKAPDSAAAAMTPPPPKALALADLAGKWNVSAKNEAGDSVLTSYVLTATADTTGWTITFPNRKPIPAKSVSVSGDSVTVDAGPYESVLRKGIQVWTHSVSRIQDGKLVGTSVAHYKVKTADSLRTLKSEGSRAP
jgi:hypothetical protein